MVFLGIKNTLLRFDFKARGLFWDHPNMTNEIFASILQDPQDTEYTWAISRLFERLSSVEILSLFRWPQVEQMLKQAKLRPVILKPWEHALEYFHQKSSRAR
ncbi:MAG: hypothetical protein HQM15_02965 [Deltaproteobacteria bacterium]|nr:hypothetical protein [Deltaproteobacteria bacterium]